MKNLVSVLMFLTELAKSKGAEFIAINEYPNEQGQIANYVVNINISVMNAKEKDLNTLKNVTDNDLQNVSTFSGIALDICQIALKEMQDSAEKNVNPDLSKRTVNSQAQTGAYTQLTPAIKVLESTGEIHIFGQEISKKVLVKGEYKEVKSSDKTLAKKAITKHLDLRAGKYRTYKLSKITDAVMKGNTFVINC